MNKLDLLANFDNMINNYASLKLSKKHFYANAGNFPDIYLKNQSKINKAEKLRSYIIKDRDLEVIYICGLSGSGKTTAAKYIADKLNYDYFVSGGGEDFLDGYDKEECIILDDFRASSMRFNELLKMLDNNTNSSIKSRYYNKDISNCKLIIITSVYQPNELYSFMQSEESSMKEPIEQLYRRLGHMFYRILENGYIVEHTLTLDGIEPTDSTLGNISDIYKELGIDLNAEKPNSAKLLLGKKISKEETMGEVF